MCAQAADDSKVVALAGWGTNSGLFVSSDFGKTWVRDANTLLGGKDIFTLKAPDVTAYQLQGQFESSSVAVSADATKVIFGGGGIGGATSGSIRVYLCKDFGSGNTWLDISKNILADYDLDEPTNTGSSLYPYAG